MSYLYTANCFPSSLRYICSCNFQVCLRNNHSVRHINSSDLSKIHCIRLHLVQKTSTSIYKRQDVGLVTVPQGRSEAANGGVLLKKVFLKISQNSQENTCARDSFLIKLQAKNKFFKEHLWATASVSFNQYISNICKSDSNQLNALGKLKTFSMG